MKRILSTFMLTALVGMTILTSCASDGGTTSTETTTADTTTATETTTAAPEVPKDFTAMLEKADYDGAEYKMLGRADGVMAPLHAYELTTESENGEILNDAIFARNMKVSEYFNVTLTSQLVPERTSSQGIVKNSVLADDKSFDLVWGWVGSMTGLVMDNVLADLGSFEQLSLDEAWWNQPVRESLTINGRQLLAFSDIPFTAMLSTHCLFMNKNIAEDRGVADIYGMCRDGKWTIDELLSATADIRDDLNGDSVYDGNDFYGFLSSYGAIGIFTTGCDSPVLEYEGDSFKLTVFTEKMQSIVESTYKLAYDNGSSYIVTNDKEPEICKMFANGQSLFYSGFIYDPILSFRDMRDDFALLPLPKYDESQESYHTTVSGGNGLIAIPKNVANEELVGNVTEALAIESYRTIRPVLFETVMADKLLRDDGSVEMFDTVVSGIHSDFAFIFSTNGYGRTLRDLMEKKTTDLSSYYESRESSSIAYYEDVVEAYLK